MTVLVPRPWMRFVRGVVFASFGGTGTLEGARSASAGGGNWCVGGGPVTYYELEGPR
ncbi:hypothetical protein Kpho01_59680 [Kitasatospora phosalacinea]|uniref:Uncharacterized protein n=1 Tax=Kitasatospora phosalacinea TaxID=2065 RepID=A0A9W6USB5_9ACTN|nr:hypothetical protein Kpho01_59680 [Kitasatospora phosalacinea]